MAINYDRGPNDLEEVIDKLKKQKEILQNRLKKLDRTQEIMALYAEVKRLKNLNEDLQRELHDRKTRTTELLDPNSVFQKLSEEFIIEKL